MAREKPKQGSGGALALFMHTRDTMLLPLLPYTRDAMPLLAPSASPPATSPSGATAADVHGGRNTEKECLQYSSCRLTNAGSAYA